MFIVIAYDIPDNKRRTRLHKLLRRYGDAVQFSVFECLISDAQFDELRQGVAKIIIEGEDDVRYYDICAACKRLTKTLGRAVTTTEQQAYIF
jgi:CRISPR-associated protein Cas2